MSEFLLTRAEIAEAFPSPRAQRRFEELQQKVLDTEAATTAGVAATDTLANATFVTLSANAELQGERVLSLGSGLAFDLSVGGAVAIRLTKVVPRVQGGFSVQLFASGDCVLGLPLAGMLATRANAEKLENKTLSAPAVIDIGDYADDVAAAAGGVGVGYVYRTGSTLKVRVA